MSSVTGNSAVDEVLRTLSGSDLARLLRYVRDWNPNAKTSGVAQGVLYAILKLRSVDDVIAAFTEEAHEGILQSSGEEIVKTGTSGNTALKELVDTMIPYTERHLSRMDRLVQDSFVVDYILSEMDDGMFDGQEIDSMDVDLMEVS